MPRLNVNLTEHAYAGWAELAELHGVSMTALVEAGGRYFKDHPDTATPVTLEMVAAARKIDIERRRRT